MTRWWIAALGLVGLGLAGWVVYGRSAHRPVTASAPEPVRAAGDGKAADSTVRQATLYCEFTNFADQTPVVGFYFLIEEAKAPPIYALIFRREKDGSQDDPGGEGAPRPEWRFDASESPAVIRAPDETTSINLYDYDPKKPGMNWFEAGLRSISYRNLGGKCRHSTA